MRRAFEVAVLLMVAVTQTAGADAPPPDDRSAVGARQPAPTETGRPAPGNRHPVSARFADLDAYLAYLEKRSHIDGAWYREVRPGIYELQTGNLRLADGDKRKRTFTRAELEKKFGFSR